MEKRNLWKSPNINYQYHVSSKSDNISESHREPVFINDLKKRKEVYGICGECNKPGTGRNWCQPCNANRFTENFGNWTSGNKDIDELIQQSQLNAVYYTKCLEWIPFEKFENVTYVTRGGFSKIYSADWSEGYIHYWDIENQRWDRFSNTKVALKSLDNSSEISTDFLNEIKSYISDDFSHVIPCFGITQDPSTKDYMIVLFYCQSGNLRNCLNKSVEYTSKIEILSNMANGLSNIHNSGKVHKDFHSGLRPKISDDTPKLISELIVECWDAKPENRPTAKKICKKLQGWRDEAMDRTGDIYTQIKECEKIRDNKTVPENIQIHPQAIYTTDLPILPSRMDF
ncbi:kinase-like domain-containing protein [Rhizophagus irregularis DAOM 181602=DAOM 197198]|nr:kinase-like domain-containing protein [Rhizophagus irregularis DAOM 181602=DAOM 197198]